MTSRLKGSSNAYPFRGGETFSSHVSHVDNLILCVDFHLDTHDPLMYYIFVSLYLIFIRVAGQTCLLRGVFDDLLCYHDG
jgi:hypothetical protein